MQWKKIDSHPNYAISEAGSIKRTDGFEVGQYKNHNGYSMVRLSNPRAELRVHCLVAQAFLTPDAERPLVNHKDFNRSNNHYQNLEWCTQWENLNHSRKAGRMQKDYWKGRRSPNAILTDSQVSEIKEKYAKGGISWESLGKEYGISKRTIGRIISGETYVPLPPAPSQHPDKER